FIGPQASRANARAELPQTTYSFRSPRGSAMKRSVATGFVAAIITSISIGIAQAQPPAAPGGQGPGGFGRGRGGFGQQTPPGPAAPVPPEVAIPRPTPEEVAKVNEEVKKLVDADNSAVKPLLEKYKSLLQISVQRPNAAATYTMSGVRSPRHEA